ncbi:putative ribonuclease H-like domain-containing protein [Tanacetum coccineum]
MAQENYFEGYSMERPPLLEADGFFFLKTRFESYIKSKDIDLWQVIQNGDFLFKMKDPKINMYIETPYEKLKDNKKRQLGKNNEAKMTLYNALPHKDYSNKNHMWKFLRSLLLRWRPKVTLIVEAKDLAELPLDELIGNLKVYEMVLRNDSVISKYTKEKVKSLALKAKITRGQTNNDSLLKNGNRFEKENRFGNGGDRFDRGRGDRSKGVGSSRRERSCYGCGRKNHFIDDCPRAKVKKAFVGGAWSNSEDGDQIEKGATYLDHSSKNHVRKFFRALPLKWRAKVTAIKEAKDLATIPLDELIENL